MNYTDVHKTEIKKLLLAILYEGQTFQARQNAGDNRIYDTVMTDPTGYPLIRVLTGVTDTEFFSTCNDKVNSRYRIQVVMKFTQNPQTAEYVIDELMNLIFDAIRVAPIGANSKWLDINIEPRADLLQDSDNVIYKEIAVTCFNLASRQNNRFP